MGTLVDLGTALTLVINNGSEIGRDQRGNVVIYTVIKGGNDSAAFAVVDALSAEVLTSIDMPGVSGSWGLKAASDGSVYMGTYGNGRMYRYVPGSDRIEDLGRLGEETFVYYLTEGKDGILYTGTYPNATLFAYDPAAKQIRNLGRVHPTEKYLDSLVYDPIRNVLYAGLGRQTARLFRIDPATGEREELLAKLLPDDYARYQSVFCMGYGLGKLFIRLSKPDHLLIIDTATETVEYYDPGGGLGLGCKTVAVMPGDDEHIYFGGKMLRSYNVKTRTFADKFPADPVKALHYQDAKFMELHHSQWPGYTMVSAAEGGRIMLFNKDTGRTAESRFRHNGTPVQVRSLCAAADGRVYTGGYMMGFSSYSDVDGTFSETHEFGQAESIADFGGKVYAGIYGNAGLYEYDPAKPWGGGNPRKLWDLMKEGQDRPFAIVGAERLNKLFIGTVPDTHSLQGALAVYDLTTTELQVYKNIVHNQGVVSLLYKDGLLYGGTTIYGGLGTSGPTETAGKLFVFDPATGEKVFELAPAAGCGTVSGLIDGPDGLIWGIAEDCVFQFDPGSRKIVYCESKLLRNEKRETVWADASLAIGKDGNVYGTNVARQFFMIRPATMELTKLGNGLRYLTADVNGTMYMSDETNLWKYTPE
ncbi:hypothetical protein FE783_01080 [Paenibacillus mesophilus]|uniref:hypothetical protein n=1 Tax=Paenibacillus mesophilus TaxID=2582849 RepID=UPI00110F2C4A|nr:hypothetical protein [Paenibacillus mesophilus]TMV52822.1 hypothetical protein FE783_01080 [Paenibacillus mesophilus]